MNSNPQLLVGTVVRVDGGDYGDWTLTYADGRRVFIDCGYVGASVYPMDGPVVAEQRPVVDELDKALTPDADSGAVDQDAVSRLLAFMEGRV